MNLAIFGMFAAAGIAFAQSAAFTLNDNGLYGGADTSGTFNVNDTFTLALYGTISGLPSGFQTDGYSLWLEAPTNNSFSSALTIVSGTYVQFSQPNQGAYPKVFTDTSGAHAGFLSDKQGTRSGDLGAFTTVESERTGDGTFRFADYTFSLNGATPGTYTIFTTTISPKASEISFDNGITFTTAFAPAAAYTITVVPEPSTWSLLGLGGLGSLGLTWLRARRRA